MRTCDACHDKPTDLFICRDCMDDYHGNLARVPDAMTELDTERVKLSRRGELVGGRSADKPLPWNEAASNLQHAIRFNLVVTAKLVNVGQEDGLPADNLSAILDWLTEREQSVAMRDGAGELVAELARLLARTRRLIDNPPEKRFIGTCPCGQRLHGWRNSPDERGHRDERWIQCECGTRHGVEESIAALEERCRDVLVTAREASGLSGVKLGTVRAWIDRRRLERIGEMEGAALVRFGDVLQLRDAS